MERLDAFVDRASNHGAALLITGGPGIGKSVFLDVACRRAAGAGTRVVRAVGVEFEAEVGFAPDDRSAATRDPAGHVTTRP